MMNQFKLAVIALTLGSAATMADDCAAPQSPTLPNGEAASLEEMLAGQKAVKEFQAANTLYRTCLEPKVTAAEVAAAGDSPSQEAKDTLNQLNESYNASVSAEEALAEDFNTELREYKEANPS